MVEVFLPKKAQNNKAGGERDVQKARKMVNDCVFCGSEYYDAFHRRTNFRRIGGKIK